MDYNYGIIYAASNILGTYTIGKLIAIFLGGDVNNRAIVRITYALFFAITTTVHLLINVPIIMLLSNILGIIALAMNYKCRLQKKLISVVYTYLVIVGIETIVVLWTGYQKLALFSQGEYNSIGGLVIIKIITYMVVLFLDKFNGIRNGEAVPSSYWFSIFFVPVSSIYILLLTLNSESLSYDLLTVEIVLFLLINFVVFYLYDKLSITIAEEAENRTQLQVQSNYIKQYELMKMSMDSIRTLNHDLKNHFMTIQAFIQSKNYEKLNHYINEILELSDLQKQYVNTGNNVLDSVLNFKIFEAERLGVKIDIDIQFPSSIDLNAYDVTVILGNLIDNAVRASKSKVVSIKVRYDKGRALLKIWNDFEGKIRLKNDGRILSTKADLQNHGIGLKSVERVIEKYNGIIDIELQEQIFMVFVMLYLEDRNIDL